jgi:hypothetical protein
MTIRFAVLEGPYRHFFWMSLHWPVSGERTDVDRSEKVGRGRIFCRSRRFWTWNENLSVFSATRIPLSSILICRKLRVFIRVMSFNHFTE